MMRTRLIRQPGQPGTKRLIEQYGSKLGCVRDRRDEQLSKRFQTTELGAEEQPFSNES